MKIIITENIFNKIIDLDENLDLAKKLYKEKNIDINKDTGFQEFKDLLVKNNNIGYIGFFTKLFLTPSGFKEQDARELYQKILDNKDLIKQLPKPLFNYENAKLINKDLIVLKTIAIFKKFTNKLTNKRLKDEILTNLHSYDTNTITDIEYFLSIDSGDQREFLTKSDKYQSVNELFQALNNFVKDYKIGFKYEIILKKIRSMSPDEITLLYNENQMIVARILQYRASKEIGSMSWCIVGSEDQFNDYTKNGINYQYFFFNFNPEIKSNLKMIAFTMDEDNDIIASHDRYDDVFNYPLEYLKNLGIKEKIFQLNKRERAKNTVGNILKLTRFRNFSYDGRSEIFNNYDEYIFDSSEYETIIRPSPKEYRRLIYEFNNLLEKTPFINNNNLDILFNKMENFPVGIYESISESPGEKYIRTQNINLIPTFLNAKGNIKIFDGDLEPFITAIRRNYPLKPESKHAILYYLKENGVDILKLSQQTKIARNKNLNEPEFAMLVKRGENFKAHIQNKLAALRRGEDVDFTASEINYAIDNGFEKVIKYYYTQLLQNFYTDALDYDDLKIYQKLGMIKDIYKVIATKARNYGQNTLNSIEHSLLTIQNR